MLFLVFTGIHQFLSGGELILGMCGYGINGAKEVFLGTLLVSGKPKPRLMDEFEGMRRRGVAF